MSEQRVRTMPLAELVEDMDLYPRHAVDPANVQSLALALEAGATLPPVVACAKSKRVVDGWHRCRAYKRVFGSEAKLPVILRSYRSDKELFEDAVRLNAAHGRRLDVIDQTRAILMLEKQGTPVDRIAVLLNVTETRVQKLRVRVAKSPTAAHAAPGTRSVTLKRPAHHLAGTTLTKEQTIAHASMPGTSLRLLAQQLRMAIESGIMNLDDKPLMAELRTLLAAIKTLRL